MYYLDGVTPSFGNDGKKPVSGESQFVHQLKKNDQEVQQQLTDAISGKYNNNKNNVSKKDIAKNMVSVSGANVSAVKGFIVSKKDIAKNMVSVSGANVSAVTGFISEYRAAGVKHHESEERFHSKEEALAADKADKKSRLE